MEKHLLVTIGDDETTWFGLRFMHGFFPDFCDLRLTLFYVDQRGPNLPAGQGQKALAKAKDWVVAEGCPATKVETKSMRSRGGTVKEIIQEALKGQYDAVIFGRRGLTWMEGLISDSVSNDVLWKDIDFPVWVCRRPALLHNKSVLLCADGSESSLCIADHVGFMIADKPEISVTIFTVQTDQDANSPEVQDVFDASRAALAANGVEEERIHERVVTDDSPAKAILAEAATHNYAVVATGMSGKKPGVIKTFQPGSTAIQLLKRVEGFTLWVCK